MKWRICTAIVAVTCTLLASAPVLAEAPPEIPIEGRLTDAEGNPIDGDVRVRFAVYESETGGSPLFTETQLVSVQGGELIAAIGASSPFDLAIFRDHSSLYVGISVEDEAEMTPRLSIGSLPYAGFAQYAGDADRLEGQRASDFARAGHTHDFADLEGVPADLLDGDDTPSYSAGAGLTLTGTTFSVDDATVQRRVVGTCSSGEAMVGVEADGSVDCQSVESVVAETDPQIGALASGGWCTSDGGSVSCTAPAPDLSNTNELQSIASVLARGNDAAGVTLTGLPAPVANSDVANKEYVDTALAAGGGGYTTCWFECGQTCSEGARVRTMASSQSLSFTLAGKAYTYNGPGSGRVDLRMDSGGWGAVMISDCSYQSLPDGRSLQPVSLCCL